MAAVGGVYEAIDGIRRFLTDVEDAAPDFRSDLDGVEEVDSKRVIAFLRTSSTFRASGIRMAAQQTNVHDLVDGKISHIRIFLDRELGKEPGTDRSGGRRTRPWTPSGRRSNMSGSGPPQPSYTRAK